MRIVVLTKPVPDPASGGERLGPDGRLVRAGIPTVINGNDEYALEAALKLTEAQGGEVTLLAMAPASAPETLRKGLAMGAHRAVLVTDPALEGSCAVSTTRVLAAALRTLEYDLVFAGIDTSDGNGGVVAAGIATLLGLPYLSYATRIEPDPAAARVRVRRLSPVGYDLLEAPWPAFVGCTQVLGEPRYPSLKGIMGAKKKPQDVVSVADLGADAGRVGPGGSRTEVAALNDPPSRGDTQKIEDDGSAAEKVVEFLAERKLV